MSTETYTIADHWDTTNVITADDDPVLEYARWREHCAQHREEWTGAEFSFEDFEQYIGTKRQEAAARGKNNWKKRYDASWSIRFDALPPEQQEEIKASPDGARSVRLASLAYGDACRQEEFAAPPTPPTLDELRAAEAAAYAAWRVKVAEADPLCKAWHEAATKRHEAEIAEKIRAELSAGKSAMKTREQIEAELKYNVTP